MDFGGYFFIFLAGNNSVTIMYIYVYSLSILRYPFFSYLFFFLLHNKNNGKKEFCDVHCFQFDVYIYSI